MPAGSRRMSRSSRPLINPILINASSGNEQLCSQRCCNKTPSCFSGSSPPTTPTVEQPAPPKHFPFPSTPTDSDLFFELIMYVFVVISAGCQYLHLYRSVWWLPNSYNNQAMNRISGDDTRLSLFWPVFKSFVQWMMALYYRIQKRYLSEFEQPNFYLIDEYLVIFILIILSRRLVYSIGCRLIEITVSPSVTGIEPDYSYFRVLLFALICVMLSVCTCFVMQNHPKVNILYLCYPILVYLILFGCTIRPFFESVKWCSNSKPPLHACSSNAAEVRKEADTLRANFNDRMRQILFSAVVNAYYAGFIPCCFAQPQLHYDTRWATQHFFFIFMGSFVYTESHLLSLRYCDILHRSALHLGLWLKMETSRSLILTSQEWRDDCLWPQGAVVKYDTRIWRSIGDCNASRPGDKGHSKFYRTFIFPSYPMCLALGLHLLVIMFQMFLLVNTFTWYKIVSLAFMMFFNYYALYKLTRDYLVSYKVYREEKDMHEKTDYN